MNTAAANIPIPSGPTMSPANHRGLPHRAAMEGLPFERALQQPSRAADPGARGQAPRTPLVHAARGGGEQTAARQAAEELVAVTFLSPLMKMARNDPFKSELFHGGQGEKAFGKRLDQHLARDMIDGMNLPLVDAVYGQLTIGFGKGVDRHG